MKWKIGIQKSHCFYHIQVVHNTEDSGSYNLPTVPLHDMWTLGELDLGKAWLLYGSLMFSLLFWHAIDVHDVLKSN